MLDGALGTGCTELGLGVVGGAHADDPHAGAPRRLNPDHGVLEDEALSRRESEAVGRPQIDFGIGLAPSDVLGCDHDREAVTQAGPAQQPVRVESRGGGGDGAGDAPGGERVDERDDAANRGRPRAREPTIVVVLAVGQTPCLGRRRRPTQEQRHGFDARPPDGETPELGLGGRHADLVQERPPCLAVVRPRVEQHAVHVEDDGAGSRHD
jgi:hypothetical protein